ncbi:MAG TPA: sigma-54 dependent transcriptional regulator [Candidatus Acidoferrum sp.]|jgi:two-component system response regulator PilR (NtrC family)
MPTNAETETPNGPGLLVAVVTVDQAAFSNIFESLRPDFNVMQAQNENLIKGFVDDPELRAMIFDLDSIGAGARDGIEVLQEIRALREDIVLLALSSSSQRSIPIMASRAGADEFFLSPPNAAELSIVLARAVEKRALELEGRRLVEQVENRSAFCSMIGGSNAMQKLYQTIQAVADSNTTVVLRGESGTGKELIAQAIVQVGNRADKPFVCLNCSALPDTLMESELFGYEKGAFTGADSAKPGLIETAHTGTLFLDEITTLTPNLQSKLLRALQEHSVQRLGARSVRKIDFRLICATNENLEEIVHQGRFREDLYYRINVVPIFVPPLRDREGDLPLLIDHFLRIFCAAAKKPLKSMRHDVMEILEDYPWPGNVRELENVIQRLVIMNNSSTITADHLPQALLYASTASQEAILIPEEGVDFDAEMERIEIAYLKAALRRTAGRKSAAAALLRVDPQRMKYLCRKLKLANG